MSKEKLKLKFLGLNIEAENPSKTTIIIVAMTLLFLTAIIVL